MDPQVRQLKDFLQLYNAITEQCFNSCVNTMMTRRVENDESSCLLNCVDKFAKANQRMMGTYIEVQGKINENRMKEYEENMKKQQELAQQQAQELETAAIVETVAPAN